MNDFTLTFRDHKLKLGENTCIMGILNVTPDSFSDGGRFFKMAHAIDRAIQMVEEGANIIDIGGESTRPYSEEVSLEEELKRVVPVIERLAKEISVPISVDTYKADVARQALDAGASIVNDISAMEMDENMAKVVADAKVPVVVMHMLGTPKTMQDNPHYDDPVMEIRSYLESVIQKAEKNGIPRSMIIADPGIGFGKTMEHNFILLKHLKEFSALDVPILVGSSRKAFIRKTVSMGNDRDPHAIEIGTQATVSASILGGAHIVRVHDVASTVATVKIIDALKRV